MLSHEDDSSELEEIALQSQTPKAFSGSVDNPLADRFVD